MAGGQETLSEINVDPPFNVDQLKEELCKRRQELRPLCLDDQDTRRPSIYRVPEHLRKLNENAYTPWHVSIGPLHHQDRKYSVMKKHKLDYTIALIDRSSLNTEKYIAQVEKLEPCARLCYAQRIDLTADQFISMLLVDGCFIVEFLCRKIRKLARVMETRKSEIKRKLNKFDNQKSTNDGDLRSSSSISSNNNDRKQQLQDSLKKIEREEEARFSEIYEFVGKTYDEWEPTTDFVFQSTRTSFEVRRDLTLLENQIPYTVLECIFNLVFDNPKGGQSIAGFAKPDFREIVYGALRTSIPSTSYILPKKDIIEGFEEHKVAHLVSFLKMCSGAPIPITNETRANGEHHIQRCNIRKFLQFPKFISLRHYKEERDPNMGNVTATTTSTPRENRTGIDEEEESVSIRMVATELGEHPCLCNMDMHEVRVPNATRLAKVGVRFKPSTSPLLEIKFHKDSGVLEVPVLIMWHHTETFFRNVMAYELYNCATKKENKSVSDYMCFMDDLIHCKEDVELLVKRGIIQNWLESDGAVSNMFNSITKHILADYSSYSSTCKELDEFRKKKFNMRKYVAVLRQDYFNQPWAIVYFITGAILQTIAAVLQAIFTIYSRK